MPTAQLGKARRFDESGDRYIEFCKSTFDKECDLSNLKIIIDCANGATYHIAEDVFKELGASTIMINNNPDGYNINRNCGSKASSPKTKNNDDLLRIAFDGDADRLIMVDHKGEEVDGDELVAIIAASWKKAGY